LIPENHRIFQSGFHAHDQLLSQNDNPAGPAIQTISAGEMAAAYPSSRFPSPANRLRTGRRRRLDCRFTGHRVTSNSGLFACDPILTIVLLGPWTYAVGHSVGAKRSIRRGHRVRNHDCRGRVGRARATPLGSGAIEAGPDTGEGQGTAADNTHT
jgi:hypothetical protein